jgi:putative ABC transport system substrate-binding protein
MAIVLRRLSEHGYTEGQNLTMEYRSAQYDYDRLPELVAELVQLPVDVILARDTPSSVAAARATSSIPIVTNGGDPVHAGLADSYARPGRNVTGVTVLNATLTTKRMELLQETIPSATRIAVIWNPSSSYIEEEFKITQSAATLLGLESMSLEARTPEQVETAFGAAQRGGADALVVLEDSLTVQNSARIVVLADQSQIPTMYGAKESVLAGGLMSYGRDSAAHERRVADLVDKILKGTEPGNIPIEQPMIFDFAVNMRTAQALGITFPNEIMLQVTEVIQ